MWQTVVDWMRSQLVPARPVGSNAILVSQKIAHTRQSLRNVYPWECQAAHSRLGALSKAGTLTMPRSRTPPCWTGLGVESREIRSAHWALSGSAAQPEHVSVARSMQSQAGVRCVAPLKRHSQHAGWAGHDEDLDRPGMHRLRIRVHRRVCHSEAG
jgi:hypothetical protein